MGFRLNGRIVFRRNVREMIKLSIWPALNLLLELNISSILSFRMADQTMDKRNPSLIYIFYFPIYSDVKNSFLTGN